MLLKDFVEDYYLPSLSDLRESTRLGYASAISLYVLPRFGDCELEEIKAFDIEQWLKSIERPGAAEKAYKTLRQIIRRAIDWDMFDAVDPTRKRIRLPKKKPYRPTVLSAKEVRGLLRGFYGHELEAVVICAVALGLRRGEACGLMWADIDLRSGLVKIERSAQYIEGRVVVVDPKTEKSARECYLPHFAIRRLREIKGTGSIIGEMTPEEVSRRYKAHCKKRKLPYTSFTNLRHTWATLALAGGADSATVAAMLGHSQIATTYEHYLVPDKKIYKNAQKGFESLILGN